MKPISRRSFLTTAAASGAALHPAIAKALAIDAAVRTGTIRDVEHVVIFMQENRSFDHYFGSMAGVRGFADRFPIPLADTPERKAASVWVQANAVKDNSPRLIAPFPLDTVQTFAHMRVEGAPHGWTDAQGAWNEGRIDRWPAVKGEHAMGYYRQPDLPFQFALADAFTLCDAYHCSIQTGTNTNRLFLWSGTNDPGGKFGGPALGNSHDHFPKQGETLPPYGWTTYAERLEAKGVTWRCYQDMADNFGDNPLVGFKPFRDVHDGAPGANPRLAEKALTTRALDGLRQDVLAGTLPQVSYIISTEAGSEHPGPSSPAQGADYTAQVIAALTADPKVWAKTVLLVMFDENDGFFDHMPPPAPPSRDASGALRGASSVDLIGEHHLAGGSFDRSVDKPEFVGRPYGLGPRVPMYVISPWSRGGFVNSQVFDHTSVIRFLEARFGVAEPNISPWRRAVCGDLTSAFNFKSPNRETALPRLPATAATAARAAALPGRTRPPTPTAIVAPTQAAGVRPSRALPYVLECEMQMEAGKAHLVFDNDGSVGAVFHVYDRQRLSEGPRRYTVEPRKPLHDRWELTKGAYDLWVLGPNGFHRHFKGDGREGPVTVAAYDIGAPRLGLALTNPTRDALDLTITTNAYGPSAYGPSTRPTQVRLPPRGSGHQWLSLGKTGGWYDISIAWPARPGWLRRYAGRMETGRDSISDPAMAGPAVMGWTA